MEYNLSSPNSTLGMACEVIRPNDSYYCYYLAIKAKLCVSYLAIRFILGTCGVVGGILEMIALRDKQFSGASFVYHKALVFTDFFYTIVYVIVRAILQLTVYNPALRTYLNSLTMAYADVSCYIAEIIVLAMTAERCVAIWLPTKFYSVNKHRVAWSAVVIAVLIGNGAYFGEFFVVGLVNINGTEIAVGTAWGLSDTFNNFGYYMTILELFVCYTSFALAIVIAVGLIRQFFTRKKLIVTLTAHEKAYNKRLIALSFLSLSCAFPVTFHETSWFVRTYFLTSPWGVEDTIVVVPSDTTTDPVDVSRAIASSWLYVVQLVGGQLAHCLHFYMYMWLSAGFRHTVMEYFCSRHKFTKVTAISLIASQPSAAANVR